MRINVGSKNKTKVKSVKDIVELYPELFANAEVTGIDIEIDIYGHPKNLSETVDGAIQRAKKAFIDCDYSFGLEGGLVEVPLSKTGFMETCACAIYDGKEIYLGLAPAFEWPKKVLDFILEGKGDASKAFKDLGLTTEEKLGATDGGIVGFLTNTKMTREQQTQYGIMMAIVQLQQKELY